MVGVQGKRGMAFEPRNSDPAGDSRTDFLGIFIFPLSLSSQVLEIQKS
jgi:hypothetical protein